MKVVTIVSLQFNCFLFAVGAKKNYLNPTWSFSSSPLMFWVPARIFEAAFSCWTFCVLACEEKIHFFMTRTTNYQGRQEAKLPWWQSNAERNYSVRHEYHKGFFSLNYATSVACSIFFALNF